MFASLPDIALAFLALAFYARVRLAAARESVRTRRRGAGR